MIIARILLVNWLLLGAGMVAAEAKPDSSDQQKYPYSLEDEGGYMSLVDTLMATGQYDAKVKQLLALNDALRESVKQEKSTLYPTLEAYATADHQYADSRSPFFGNFKEKYQSHTAGVRFRQPIFRTDWFDKLDRADAFEKNADIELEMYRMSLMVEVAQGYFDYLAAQSNLLAAQAEANAVAEALGDMRKRYDVELVAKTDLQEAQARNDLAQASLLQAQQDLANAESKMHLLTGWTEYNLPRLPADIDFPELEPEQPQQWVELAYEHNIHVLQAEQELRIAQADQESRKAEYMPTVDLVAEARHNDNISSANGVKSDSAVVGVELNVPIYAGGVGRSRERQAAAKVRAAKHGFEHSKHNAEMKTRTLFRNVEISRKQVQAYDIALRSARSAKQAIANGYEAGTRTITDVLNAQSAVTEAKKNYTNARYGLLLAILKLKQVAGVLELEDFKVIDRLLIPEIAQTTIKDATS